MDHLLMRLPSLTQIPPVPEPPAGYTLRSYRDEDLDGLSTLLSLAFDDVEWSPALVRERLADTQEVKKIFVIDFGGAPVATASARIAPEEYPGSGYVHWVAVHPDHRGKQLGKTVTLAVLAEFVRLGCADAVLETEDHRLAAIRLYKSLGFEEVHKHQAHALRWAMIADLLASANL